MTVSVRPIMEIMVTDAKSEAEARSAAGQVATLMKRVKARTEELLAPLKAQEAAIKTARDKVLHVLNGPDQHIRGQQGAYAAEIRRQQEEARRIQQEKEAAERRAADEARRKAEAELRAKQEAERKDREDAARAGQERIQAELEAKRKAAEAEAARKAQAASLFGAQAAAQKKAEAEARAAQEKAEAEAAAQHRAAEQRAADERKVLQDQQERERIAEEARLAREEDELHARQRAEQKAIEEQRVKGSKLNIVVDVVNSWAVPREFLRAPEVELAKVKKAYKAGRREFPGLTIREEVSVIVRSEAVPRLGGVAS